ncbi:hypothetical protein LTR56_022477 [Elasticomyces elasticus]|nr:hypothetical protein LTR22_025098 [Elasticomyces elasticus]KAK3621967.1 hypothetical protein LTR56_022477 [Elasticomyces elasticus]KAK4908339.1 hypothetical protein LTR49_022755 [Elasticomyces elasticus]KAK5748364.1 hypothetical protein LTS12_021583 [Elasticomyces elasticus]
MATPPTQPAVSVLDFTPTVVVEMPGTMHQTSSTYQSLTAMDVYRDYSSEELRLMHYETTGGTSGSGYRPEISGLTAGTVRLDLPASQVWCATKHLPPPHIAARPRHFTSEIVYLDVGKPDQIKRFAMHESIVRPASDFVNMALSRDWKEARERVIPLSEDEPETFTIYQTWLYTHIVDAHALKSSTNSCDVYQRLFKCYILAEKLLDAIFKDCVMDAILNTLQANPLFDANLSNLVYENTPEGSPLRRLLCEIYVWCATERWLAEDVVTEEVHPSLMTDVMKMQMGFFRGQRPEQVPFLGHACAYHAHEGGSCYQRM